jgi:hypothetical protein
LKSLTTFFVVYTIALSFIPLIHQTLIAQSTWLGYGTGAYAFQSPSYFVLFNDPYDGSSKPNIHVNPSFAPNERISLVEFSDWTSYVDGYNLFNDFNVTIRASSRILDATYARPGLILHKFVDLTLPDSVLVKFVANREVTAHFELWKWIMTSVNGITIREAPKPITIPISTSINFTFEDQTQPATGSGEITLSRVPTQIEVWPFESGFDRVTVDFVNSEMTFSVSGLVAEGGRTVPAWNYADLPYVLPIIAIMVVAVYLLVERHGQKDKDHTRRARR